jgi:ABC-type transporter Mla MlaB component
MSKKSKSSKSGPEVATELVLAGEVTVNCLDGIRTQFLDALIGHGPIHVNTKDLAYIDAAALQLLWALRRESEVRGRPLLIDVPSESVLKDVQRLGMQCVFENVRAP